MVKTTREEYPFGAASARATNEGETGTALAEAVGAPISAALTKGVVGGEERVPFLRGGTCEDAAETPARLSGDVGARASESNCRWRLRSVHSITVHG